jgi:uncharacterized damage-inducible protein DinB
MSSRTIEHSWDYFRQVFGIGLRAIAALPQDQLDSHPIPDMRTPKELVVHLVSNLGMLTKGVDTGEVHDVSEAEKATAARLKTVPELVAWSRTEWTAADRLARAVTPEKLAAKVKTPWGSDFDGFVMYEILYDEFWHHRGQLYTYLRAMGVAPAMIYDFEGNEPEFQPKAAQKA